MIPLAVYLILIATGAGAIALWIDNRWPSLRPGLSTRLLLHIIATTLAGRAAPQLIGLTSSRATALLTTILLLTYCFLAAIWVLHAVRDRLPGGGGGLGEMT